MASFALFVGMLGIALALGVVFNFIIEYVIKTAKGLQKHKDVKRLREINLYYIIGILFAFVESLILLMLNP